MDWTFHEGELDHRDVGMLLAHHVAEMNAGSPPSACHVLPVDGLRHPAIRFLTVRDAAGVLLGCGALKRLSDDHGEVKSMRTAGYALGRGVGRAVLEQIIAMAGASGMVRLSLETGNSPLFAPANHLYRRAGFNPCEAFGGYGASDFTTFYTRSI